MPWVKKQNRVPVNMFCFCVFEMGVKTFLWHFNLFRDFIYSLPADRRNAKHGISERLSTPRKTFFPPKQVER